MDFRGQFSFWRIIMNNNTHQKNEQTLHTERFPHKQTDKKHTNTNTNIYTQIHPYTHIYIYIRTHK